MRGTGCSVIHICRFLRFIPACAGNRVLSAWHPCLSSVHPRVCGEQPSRFQPCSLAAGSSPRVRGTARSLAVANVRDRFIPACAGNSVRFYPIPIHRSVHPRVCGEQLTRLGVLWRCAGSSPRVRGTAHASRCTVAMRRFIPACAGNRIPARNRSSVAPVHPRVCGEQRTAPDAMKFTSGSSPRVRGTGVVVVAVHGVSRFIPACAGNSALATLLMRDPSVHPRVCGEQESRKSSRFETDGSSPRVRGTVGSRPVVDHVARFIPACAGNSVYTVTLSSSTPVHPRVCGEQAHRASHVSHSCGSSPRVRGTGQWVLCWLVGFRFIPACAGNSHA